MFPCPTKLTSVVGFDTVMDKIVGTANPIIAKNNIEDW